MAKKPYRARKEDKEKKEVVETKSTANPEMVKEGATATQLPPIDPIYLMSPVERANALPDYSKTFTREKHLQMVNNSINSDLATIQRISQYGAKYLSVHELQILDMARRSLDQKNDERHIHQRYMWERAWGKDVQKMEHSGAINQSDAAFMDTFGIDSISPDELDEIAGIGNDSNDN